jgi:hypothetical protein
MSNLSGGIDKIEILTHLNALIRLQGEMLIGYPRRPADDTRDWLAINFLFRIGREYHRLTIPARDQLDVIFRGWTSPEPLTLQEFTSMLESLRELIAEESGDFRPATPFVAHALPARA